MTTAPPRIAWMDALRGFAILLVIFNHSVMMLGLLPGLSAPVFTSINEVFAPLRMPLLVFASGLLVDRGLRKGTSPYLRGKVRAILWPFGLWFLIALVIETGLNLVSNRGFPWELIWGLPIGDGTYLWFLFNLFCYYVIALIVPRKFTIPIAIVATIAAGFTSYFPADRFLTLFAFFFVGRWVGTNLASFTALVSKWYVWVPSGFIWLLFVGLTQLWGFNARYEALASPAIAFGIIAMVGIFARLTEAFTLQWLTKIGKASIIFYLVHYYPTTLGGRVIDAFLPNGSVVVLAAFAIGLLASYLVFLGAKRFEALRWLFYWNPGKEARF